jgi:BNR/Asp-box repeat
MTAVRVLVGTQKGGFVLTSDGTRAKWDVSGPYFGGWEIYHMVGAPSDPDRLYASQTSGWFGQLIQRSDDGGKSWQPAGNQFVYDGVAGTHQWYDGTPHPWEFARVWHLEPSPTDPDTVFAGAEDASLFKSTDGAATWSELPGLRTHKSGPNWQPGAGGMCVHTILIDERNPDHMHVAISAAGVFRSEDGGASWRASNRGLSSEQIPDPDADVGHCVHRIARHRTRPDVLFMQKHWDVMRSDDDGDSWREVSGNLPSDFGFPIGVHAHEPDTVYVVPIKSDSEHYPPDGRLRVFRSRTGGDEWESLERGLPQGDCYVNVLRDAMAIDSLEPCGVYFGTTGGQVYTSADAGDSWDAAVRDLPRVLSVEVQTLP